MRPGFIIGTGLLVLVLVVSLFGLTSLNLPFIAPGDSSQTLLLFTLSSIIFLGLIIFGFILFRSLLKLFLERRANVLGAKFKTKLVAGAIGLSVLPVIFLFLFSYSLVNRTLDKWFSRPVETMSRDAHDLAEGLAQFAQRKNVGDSLRVASDLQASAAKWNGSRLVLQSELRNLLRLEDLDYIAVVNAKGDILAESSRASTPMKLPELDPAGELLAASSEGARLAVWRDANVVLSRQRFDLPDKSEATLIVGTLLPADLAAAAKRLDDASLEYSSLTRERRTVRATFLGILWLLAIVTLFIATWFALIISRQLTTPIQALAEATHEVSRGNLDYRVQTLAADELGVLVKNFNEMTAQLAAGRAERERARATLEEANRLIDLRRRFTEAILESIPTGVISITAAGTVLNSNPAARRMFGDALREGAALEKLFAPEDWVELQQIIKRAARLGQVTGDMEVPGRDRYLQLAVTVSALPGSPPGAEPSAEPGAKPEGWFVVVADDLSDLLAAQKAAAWGEVAKRVAHEIKNPLTPIALSAERIRWWLERQKDSQRKTPAVPAELTRVVEEASTLIGEEVEALKKLVDEFSQFARFPQARPAPANLNQIVESALGSFNGRLEGIRISTQLSDNLPLVEVDPDQFRRVLVNLMDNAAEAMQGSPVKEIVVSTRTDADRSVVETEIADTGCGVSTEDKERLFLPYYSTKDRGSGLGLAIVSRIVAEHHGAIRVEENDPLGTRFIVELPVSAG
jgi:PAS domain S-box-containing protein